MHFFDMMKNVQTDFSRSLVDLEQNLEICNLCIL